MPPIESYRIGCAGWSIPKTHAGAFPNEGSHLERYAERFNAVEINSSFYKPHRPETYARWADAVPEGFRFAVKVPKAITHESRLKGCEAGLDRFLGAVSRLGPKLGPLLVQLPPSLKYSDDVAETFFTALRERFDGYVALEPRHPSWFDGHGDESAVKFRIGRVAADPAVVPAAASPGGWPGLAYHRLHGSPKIYYSSYSKEDVDTLSTQLASDASTSETWCIFDNTALGAATANALELRERLSGM